MAKQQRGSTRAQNRPAASASSSNQPAGQRRSGQKSSDSWQPNRVSATKASTGPNRTALITVGAVIVGILIVGYVMLQQLGGPTVSSTDLTTPGAANMTPNSIPSSGRTLGNANAPVTIDLYGDFRCSACYHFTESGTAEQIDSQLVATGQAKLVWHDFLVIDLGQHNSASLAAANAAWCAADQGKFWLMHDWLFANQSPTESPDAFTQARLLAIGQAAGLDMSTFQSCVEGGTHVAEIQAEQTSMPAGVTYTPAVMVNNTLVNASFDAVKSAVDAVLKGSPVPTAAPS